MDKQFNVPQPIIDEKETKALDSLTETYKKMITPSKIGTAVSKVGNLVPGKIKNVYKDVGENISQKELYQKVLEIISSSFNNVRNTYGHYKLLE